MEGLLSALVNRALSRFIRTADDSDNLRVNVQRGGGLLLSNLELNLDPLMAKLPGFTVSRAFAMRLQVVIPWTNLFGAPIQIQLDTVEVVLDVHEEALANWVPPVPDVSTGEEGSASWGSWLLGWSSYLQSQLRKVVGNVEVSLKNVVIKLRTLRHVATITCQSVDVHSGTQGVAATDSEDDWLNKTLDVNGFSLSVSEGSVWSTVGARLVKLPKASLRMAFPWPPGSLGLMEPAPGPVSNPNRPASFSLEVQPVEVASTVAHLGDLRAILQTVLAVRKKAASLVQESAVPRSHMTHHESLPRMTPGLPAVTTMPSGGRANDFIPDFGFDTYMPVSAMGGEDPESGSIALDMFGTPIKQAAPSRRAGFLSHNRSSSFSLGRGTTAQPGPSDIPSPPLLSRLELSMRILGVAVSILPPQPLAPSQPPSATGIPSQLASAVQPVGGSDHGGQSSLLRDFAEVMNQYQREQTQQQQPRPGYSPSASGNATPLATPPPPTAAQLAAPPEIASFELGTIDLRANVVLGTGYGASLSLHYAHMRLLPGTDATDPPPSGSSYPQGPTKGGGVASEALEEVFALRPGEGSQWAVHSTFQGPLGASDPAAQPGSGISLSFQVGDLNLVGSPEAIARLKQLSATLSPPQHRAGASQPPSDTGRSHAFSPEPPSLQTMGSSNAPALPPRPPRNNNPLSPSIGPLGGGGGSSGFGLNHMASSGSTAAMNVWPTNSGAAQAARDAAAADARDGRSTPWTPLEFLLTSESQGLELHFSLQRIRVLYFAAEGPVPCAAMALCLDHVTATLTGQAMRRPAPAPLPTPSMEPQEPPLMTGRSGAPSVTGQSEASFSGRPLGPSASAGHSRNPSWASSVLPSMAPLVLPDTPHKASHSFTAHSPTGTVVVHSRALSWSSQMGSPLAHHAPPGPPPGVFMPTASAPPPEKAKFSLPLEIIGVWSVQGGALACFMGAACARPPAGDPRVPAASSAPQQALRDCGFTPILFADTPEGAVPWAGMHMQGHLSKSEFLNSCLQATNFSASTSPLRLILGPEPLRALSALVPSLGLHLSGPQGIQQLNVQLTGNPHMLWSLEAGLEFSPLSLAIGADFALGPDQPPLCRAELRISDATLTQPEGHVASLRNLSASMAAIDLLLQQTRFISFREVQLHRKQSSRRSSTTIARPGASGDAPCDHVSVSVKQIHADLSSAVQNALVGLVATLPTRYLPAHVRTGAARPGGGGMSRVPSASVLPSSSGVLSPTLSDMARPQAFSLPIPRISSIPVLNTAGGAEVRRSLTAGPTQPPRRIVRIQVLETVLSAALWDAQSSPRELPCLYSTGRMLKLTDTEARQVQLQLGPVRCIYAPRRGIDGHAQTPAASSSAAPSRDPQLSLSLETLSMVSRRQVRDGRVLTMPLIQPPFAASDGPQQHERHDSDGVATDLDPDFQPLLQVAIFPPTSTQRKLVEVSCSSLSIRVDSDLLNLAKWTIFRHQRRCRVLRGLPEYGEDRGPARVQGLAVLAQSRLGNRSMIGFGSQAAAHGTEIALQTAPLSLDLMTSLDPSEPEWYRTEFTVSGSHVRVAPQPSSSLSGAVGGSNSNIGPLDDRVRSIVGLSPIEVHMDLHAVTATCWSRTLPPSGHIVMPPTNATAAMVLGGNPQTSLLTLRMPAVQCSLSVDAIFAFYRPLVSAIKIAMAVDPSAPLATTVLPDDIQSGIWAERVPRGPLTEPLGPMQMTLSSRWIGPGSSLPESDPPPPPKFSRWILWRYSYARPIRRVLLAAGGATGEVSLMSYAKGTWEVVVVGAALPDGSLALDITQRPPESEIWALGWSGTEHPETFLARLMINPGSGLEGPEVPAYPAPQRLSSIFTMSLEAPFAMVRWCDHPPSSLDSRAMPSSRELAMLDLTPCTLRLDMPPETNACIALRAGAAKLYAVDAFSRTTSEVLDVPGMQFGFEYTIGEFKGPSVHPTNGPSSSSPRQPAWLPSDRSPLWTDVRLPRPNPQLGGIAVLLRGAEGSGSYLRLTRGVLETTKVAMEDAGASSSLKRRRCLTGPRCPWVDEDPSGRAASSGVMGPVCPPRVVRVVNELPFDLWVAVPTSPEYARPPSKLASPEKKPPAFGGRWAHAKGVAVISGPAVGFAGGIVTVCAAGTSSDALEIRARSPGKKLFHLRCGPEIFTPVAVSVAYSSGAHAEGVGGAWIITLSPGLVVRNESSIALQVRCATPAEGSAAEPGAALLVADVANDAQMLLSIVGTQLEPLDAGRAGTPSRSAATPTYYLGLGERSHFLPWFEIGPELLGEMARTKGGLTLLGGQMAGPAAVCAIIAADINLGSLALTLRDPMTLTNPLPCPLMVEFIDPPATHRSSIVGQTLHPAVAGDADSRFPLSLVLEPGTSAPSSLASGRKIRFRCGAIPGAAPWPAAGGAAGGWGAWSEPLEAPRVAPASALEFPASLPTRTSVTGETMQILPPLGSALVVPTGDATEVVLGTGPLAFPAVVLSMLEGGTGPVKLSVHPRASVRNQSAVNVEVVNKATGMVLCSLGPSTISTNVIAASKAENMRAIPLPWNADDAPMFTPIVLRARISDPSSQWQGTTWVSESVTLTAEPSTMELRLTASSLPSTIRAAAQDSAPPPTLKLVLRLATSRPIGGVNGPKFVLLSILPTVTVLNEASIRYTVVHRLCSAVVGPGELQELSLLGNSSVIQLQTDAGGISDPVDLSTLGTAGVAVVPVFMPAEPRADGAGPKVEAPVALRVVSRWLGLGIRRDSCQLQITLIDPDVAPVVLRNSLASTIWAAIPPSAAVSTKGAASSGMTFVEGENMTPLSSPSRPRASLQGGVGSPAALARDASGHIPETLLRERASAVCWIAVLPGESRPLYIPESSRPLFGIGGVRGSGQVPGTVEEGPYLLDQLSYSPAKRPGSEGTRSKLGDLIRGNRGAAPATSGPVLLIRRTEGASPVLSGAPDSFEASVPLIPGTDYARGGVSIGLETSGPTVIATVRESSSAPGVTSSDSGFPAISGVGGARTPVPIRLDVGVQLRSLVIGLWEPTTGPSFGTRSPEAAAAATAGGSLSSPQQTFLPGGAQEFAALEMAGFDVSFERRKLPSDPLPAPTPPPPPVVEKGQNGETFQGTHVQSALRLFVRELDFLVFGPAPRAAGRLVARVSPSTRVTRRQYEHAVALEAVQRTLAVGSGWSVSSYPMVRLNLSPVQLQLDDDVLEDLVATGREWALLATEYFAKPPAASKSSMAAVVTHPVSGAATPPVRASLGTETGDAMAAAASDAVEALAGSLQPSYRRYVWLGDVYLGEVRAILDLNLSHVGPQALPLVLDTRQSPLVLAPVRIGGALFDLQAAREGLVAHYTAEALLNAPQLLGSVSWLFNVTGLVQSLRSGLRDMVVHPLAQLTSEEGSTTAFLAEVGGGTASLLRHLSSWSLTSLAGFSSTMARTLETLTDDPQAPGERKGRPTAAPPPRPSMLGSVRRSILQAVTLPLSGALDLLGTASAVLAASAGLDNAESGRTGGLQSGYAHDLLAVPRPVCDGYLFSIPACLMGVNGQAREAGAEALLDQIGVLVVISLQPESGRVIASTEGIGKAGSGVSTRTLFVFGLGDVHLEVENGVFIVLLQPQDSARRDAAGRIALAISPRDAALIEPLFQLLTGSGAGSGGVRGGPGGGEIDHGSDPDSAPLVSSLRRGAHG